MAIPLLTLDGQNVKLVNHYEYLQIILNNELSDDKDFERQLRHQYCAANNLRAFSQCSNAVKNVIFRSFCYLCIHVFITIMVYFQKGMHAEIVCGI